MAIAAIAQALMSYASQRSASKQMEAQLGASKEVAQINRELRERELAQEESTYDPFRHALAQASALGRLDLAERGTYSPMQLKPAERYAQYVPTMGGGMDYTKSPEFIKWANLLKQAVAAGQTAPSMTDPRNYGRTGTFNLLGPTSTAGVPPMTTGYNPFLLGQEGKIMRRRTDVRTGRNIDLDSEFPVPPVRSR